MIKHDMLFIIIIIIVSNLILKYSKEEHISTGSVDSQHVDSQHIDSQHVDLQCIKRRDFYDVMMECAENAANHLQELKDKQMAFCCSLWHAFRCQGIKSIELCPKREAEIIVTRIASNSDFLLKKLCPESVPNSILCNSCSEKLFNTFSFVFIFINFFIFHHFIYFHL